MDFRLNDATSSGLVSAFTFTSLNRPPYSRSSFSISGPSDLQGPHQGAQKSTMTGTSMEASITSRSNEDNVASIMGFFLSREDREGEAGSVRVRLLLMSSDADMNSRGTSPTPKGLLRWRWY